MPQPWKAKTHRVQNIDGPVAVLNVGGMDENEDLKAAGIGEDVALASLNLFASIKPTNPATLGGFDALAVMT